MSIKISEAQNLKSELENDIAELLLYFELKTGLKPGIVFRERREDGDTFKYIVHIPVNL